MSKCHGMIYNIILTLIVQLIFLSFVVAPLQLVAEYSPGDLFAVVVLLYSSGIAWYQCYTISEKLFCQNDTTDGKWRQLGTKPSGRLSNSETVGKPCYFIYKVGATIRYLTYHESEAYSHQTKINL